jgi:hypothetical protein
MESRFRVKFWPRRAKTAPCELDVHSVPYQTATDGQKAPVFIHQALGRNLSEKRKQTDDLSLRGVAYGSSNAGKPPVIGDKPLKGNGPIKLNAARRLSSGDLQLTEPNQDHILEGLRDGAYDIAGREVRESRSLSSTRPPTADRRQSQSSYNGPGVSHRLPPVSTPAAWAPFSGSSPLLEIPENGRSRLTGSHSIGPPTSASNNWDLFGRPFSAQSSSVTEGLGILELPHQPHSILKKSTSMASLVEPTSEQSATIRALWKAEYKQLVAIYGETGVSKNIGEVPWEQKRLSTIQDVGHHDERTVPFVLNPLPRPSFEHREGVQKRASRQSKSEHHHSDDTSDESLNQRSSLISSAGYASSYTTRTSIAESDAVSTQQDIRKIVENMRTTYIQAIEAREPSLHALKSIKKRKKRTSNTPQSTPRASSIPSTPELERRSSSHANASSPSLRSQRSTRVVSQPVATISTLPAIEASPTRSKDPEAGLKRADSATLGTLMGESKRSSISKRKSERRSRRQSHTTSSPRESSENNSSAPGDTESHSTSQGASDEHLVSLFRDIFSGSNDDFWKCSPALTTTLAVSPVDSTSRPLVL